MKRTQRPAPVENRDDTTTNATFYPLFTNAINGEYPAWVSSSKLTYNPSTGLFNSASVDWANPGTIGSNTPNTGAFTVGTFSSSLTLNSTTSVIVGRGYGIQGGMQGQRANGTIGAETDILSGHLIAQYTAHGWVNGAMSGRKAGVLITATQNWTSTANGTTFTFEVCPNGSTSTVEAMRVQQNSTVTLGGPEASPALSVIPVASQAAWATATGATSTTNPKIGTNTNNLVLGSGAAIATTATTGYVMIPSCAGTPTGVPVGNAAGQIGTVYDSTNNRIYFYNGAWRSVLVA